VTVPFPAGAPPRAKVCGLTRGDDARAVLDAGADYLGLVFAEGPRRVDPARAAEIARAAPAARWVGVFAGSPAADILALAGRVPFRVVQLHGDETPETAGALRAAGLEVWQAVGVDEPPAWDAVAGRLEALAGRADAVLLDRRRDGRSGGGGVPFRWAGVPARVRGLLAATRFVLSGGLTPDNVAAAVRELAPDVVDASTGLERRPGRKDPARVAAFVRAAHGAGAAVLR
jgi:phosphoribosylanthranilate isomerase